MICVSAEKLQLPFNNDLPTAVMAATPVPAPKAEPSPKPAPAHVAYKPVDIKYQLLSSFVICLINISIQILTYL